MIRVEHLSNPSCVLCLEEFDETDSMIRLGCSHCFHCNCFSKLTKKECPCCRSPFDVQVTVARNEEEEKQSRQLLDNLDLYGVKINHFINTAIPEVMTRMGSLAPQVSRVFGQIKRKDRRIVSKYRTLALNLQMVEGQSVRSDLYDDTIMQNELLFIQASDSLFSSYYASLNDLSDIISRIQRSFNYVEESITSVNSLVSNLIID